MRQSHLVLHRSFFRRARRVERNENIRRVFREVLKQIHPVRHADALVRGLRAAPFAFQAVPARPRLAVARHKRRVRVQVHVVRLVPHGGQSGALGGGGGVAEDRQSLVAVGRHDDLVEEPRVRGTFRGTFRGTRIRPGHGDGALRAGRVSAHGGDVGVELDGASGQRGDDGVDVRLASALHDAPQRPLDDVQQVVIDPEPDERDDRERHRVLVRATPDRRAHRHHVVFHEKTRVLVSRQVLAEGGLRVLLGVRRRKHPRRFFPEPQNLPDHVPKRGS
mmetsp:Transcript_1925/g.7993  ORF Transcript_1925/g.7993 Transcript_1925/m.7993 type:complete len:277 (+) Transcript_1925:3672-4502(+)